MFTPGRTRRGLRAIAAAVLLCLLLASGCSGGAPRVSASAPAKRTIALVPPDTDDAFEQAVAVGFESALTELGPRVRPATTPEDRSSQAKYLESLIRAGVAGIVISPDARPETCAAIKAAMAVGVKVVTFGTATSGGGCGNLSVKPATTDTVAATLADLIGDQIDYGGIAVLASSKGSTQETAWIQQLKRDLAAGHPNIAVQAVAYAQGEDNSAKATARLLHDHPELRGIVATTSTGMAGAARQLALGTRRVALTGLGTPNALRRYVENGRITEFAYWNPEELGYLAAYTAHAMATGEIRGAVGEKFTAGRLMQVTVEGGPAVSVGGLFRFNRATIDRFEF